MPERLGHPVVGVIGGMGPQATVDLMQRVVSRTPAEDDVDHIHMIVDNNPKVPSRIAALIEETGPSPLPELVRMAKGLEASGATLLAMPCNTAHGYASEIAASVGIPLLDMVALTVAQVAARPLPHRRIGLLASTAVLKLGLYEKAFAAQGIDTLIPARQDDLMAVIRAVKRGETGPTTRDRFAAIGQELFAAGADVLVIACTELSLFVDVFGEDTPALDAMDVLAEEIIRAAGIAPLGRVA